MTPSVVATSAILLLVLTAAGANLALASSTDPEYCAWIDPFSPTDPITITPEACTTPEVKVISSGGPLGQLP